LIHSQAFSVSARSKKRISALAKIGRDSLVIQASHFLSPTMAQRSIWRAWWTSNWISSQGPRFDAAKVSQFHQTADAAVVLDELFQQRHEPPVVLMRELAADPHPEDLSRALIQSLDHWSVLP